MVIPENYISLRVSFFNQKPIHVFENLISAPKIMMYKRKINKAKIRSISSTHNQAYPSRLFAQCPQAVLVLTPVTSVPTLFTPVEVGVANFIQK